MGGLTRLGTGGVVMLAVIAVLVLADVGLVVVRLTSPHPAGGPVAATKGNTPTGHPCNHGFYVSQAAHKHKGGAYVRGVARSGLGKNGSCSAPVPAD
jgi:hypothetical protein